MTNYTPTLKLPPFAPTCIMGIVICTSAILVTETAGFLRETLSIPVWKSYCYAIVTEIISIALIEYLVLSEVFNFSEWVLRKVCICILILIFCVMVGASAMYAVSPVLKADNMGVIEKAKLQGYDKLIVSQTAILESVRGQKRNSAVRSQELAKTIAKKEQLLADMKPDSTIAGAGKVTIVIMVFLRLILQSGSWLLSGIAGRMFRRQKPCETVIYHDKNIKPRDFVLTYHPDARCEKDIDNNTYKIKVNGTEVIGTPAKNSPLAWASARMQLQ